MSRTIKDAEMQQRVWEAFRAELDSLEKDLREFIQRDKGRCSNILDDDYNRAQRCSFGSMMMALRLLLPLEGGNRVEVFYNEWRARMAALMPKPEEAAA